MLFKHVRPTRSHFSIVLSLCALCCWDFLLFAVCFCETSFFGAVITKLCHNTSVVASNVDLGLPHTLAKPSLARPTLATTYFGHRGLSHDNPMARSAKLEGPGRPKHQSSTRRPPQRKKDTRRHPEREKKTREDTRREKKE